MDNLTHTLFALTLARTRLRPAGPAGRATTAVLLLSSNAPDIDIVTAFSGASGSYLAAHRGFTHGPLATLLLGLTCASLVWSIRFARRRRGEAASARQFGRLATIGILGVALHVLMDLPTSYGTRLLSPFSPTWYAFDWLPIVDVILLLILAGGLLAGRARPGARRQIAAVTLALVFLNYAVHATAHAAAITRANGTRAWGLISWNHEAGVVCDPDAACPSVAAIPTFAAPFSWRIVRPMAAGYEIFGLNVLTGRRTRPVLVANELNEWTALARESRLGAIFYGFSRFPAATVRSGGDRTIVRAQDVRFTGAALNATDDRSPFVAVIEFDPNGRVVRERLGR